MIVMVKELTRAIALLIAMPIFAAAAMVITASRDYALAVIYPIILTSLILTTYTRPRVSIELALDKQVMYVGDELNVRLRLRVDGGFGILIIRGPPAPNTESANAFELAQGKNVYVAFKGFGGLSQEFSYKLKALRRGRYVIGGIDYTYHHAFGISGPIKGTVNTEYLIEVLPRIKIINRVPSMKLKQEIPRQSPARLGPYSTEFRSVRDYVVGDPYKFINWKATARDPARKLKVNDYEREGSRTILFILDSGWWMRYGTYEENPLEFGIPLLLSLVRALIMYGLNVGLWIPQANIYVAPTSGSTQYHRILTGLISLEAMAPRLGWEPNQAIEQSNQLIEVRRSHSLNYDPAIMYIISRERPMIIYLTNVTKESINSINTILRVAPPLGSLLIDITPSTIVLSKYMGTEEVGCMGRAMMFERGRLYSLFPRGVKVITWDPYCEPMGLVIMKILNSVRVVP